MNKDKISPENIFKNRALLTETDEMWREMHSDYFKINLKLKEETDKREAVIQFWRRLAVRVALSIIESLCFRMKITILSHNELFGKKLSPRIETPLREETYALDEKGETMSRNAYYEPKRNLRFVFKEFAKVFNPDFRLKVDDKGWASYREALKIRNRITHPKNLWDLNCSEEEYKMVTEAYNWFERSITQLLMPEEYEKYIKSLESK